MKGLRMVMDRPLTGVGIDCFGTANAMSYSVGRHSFLESHSLYVQVPAEMGLFGAFAFFSFVVEFLRVNRRAASTIAEDEDAKDWQFEQALLLALFTGTVVLLTTGIFGHSLMRRTWYLYAALGLSTWRIHAEFIRRKTLATWQDASRDQSGIGWT
jgi:O-antigen ligase